jgi:hypothetical protein
MGAGEPEPSKSLSQAWERDLGRGPSWVTKSFANTISVSGTQPEETIKNGFLIFGSNTNAGIGNFYANAFNRVVIVAMAAGEPVGPDHHLAAWLGELQRIADQIAEHLQQQIVVAKNWRQIGL